MKLEAGKKNGYRWTGSGPPTGPKRDARGDGGRARGPRRGAGPLHRHRRAQLGARRVARHQHYGRLLGHVCNRPEQRLASAPEPPEEAPARGRPYPSWRAPGSWPRRTCARCAPCAARPGAAVGAWPCAPTATCATRSTGWPWWRLAAGRPAATRCATAAPASPQSAPHVSMRRRRRRRAEAAGRADRETHPRARRCPFSAVARRPPVSRRRSLRKDGARQKTAANAARGLGGAGDSPGMEARCRISSSSCRLRSRGAADTPADAQRRPPALRARAAAAGGTAADGTRSVHSLPRPRNSSRVRAAALPDSSYH